MDTEVIAQSYMKKYNELVDRSNINNIEKIVDDLNNAVNNEDMALANSAYEKILSWNFRIGNLEGERESLNSHIRGFKLPSVMMFSVMYDNNDKLWKFST